MIRHFVCVLVAVILTSCTSMPKPEGKPLPEIGFAHLDALDLNVKERDVRVQPTRNSAEFTQNLDEMMQIYLMRKLNPVGVSGKVVAALDESSIVLVEENSPNAAADFFGLGGFDVYKVTIRLRLEHYDAMGSLVYGTVVNAHRAIKITEHASIAERERAQFEGLEQLFLMLDSHVNKVFIKDMQLNTQPAIGL